MGPFGTPYSDSEGAQRRRVGVGVLHRVGGGVVKTGEVGSDVGR